MFFSLCVAIFLLDPFPGKYPKRSPHDKIVIPPGFRRSFHSLIQQIISICMHIYMRLYIQSYMNHIHIRMIHNIIYVTVNHIFSVFYYLPIWLRRLLIVGPLCLPSHQGPAWTCHFTPRPFWPSQWSSVPWCHWSTHLGWKWRVKPLTSVGFSHSASQ